MSSSAGAAASTMNEEGKESLESRETFKFHAEFTENSNNGLCFNNVYLPEEIVVLILSYIEPKEILKATLVCKKWCNLIKSGPFWGIIYSRVYNKKAKKLPWYVYYCLFTTDYFNKNLIKNGNGQNKYDHWKIVQNGGDRFAIEDPPSGADPLPLDVPEFNGRTSCFATSYSLCSKSQEISIEKCPLMQLIFNQFKPHIYLSEWVAGRFDCGCVYNLSCNFYGEKPQQSHSPNTVQTLLDFDADEWEDIGHEGDDGEVYYLSLESEYGVEDNFLHGQQTGTKVEQWAGSKWSKIELVVQDYSTIGVKTITFQHDGRDTQFWAGHYGSKMAGGVLKFLFDSIEPSA